MSLFRLFVDSSTGLDIDPEYDYKDGAQKIEDVHRAKSGAQYRYKWGQYSRIEFSVMHVNSSFKSIVNSWWSSNVDLKFMEVGVAAREVSVHLVNKSNPVDKPILPYYDEFTGKLILETYL